MAKQREPLTEVEIYGQRYSLRGSDDVGYVESLAAHVEERMRDIASTTATVDSLKVAVLAALNITDELFRLKKERSGDGGQIEERLQEMSAQLSGLLDEAISSAQSTD